MEYLLPKDRQGKKTAHYWTGADTACSMWSTGGIRKNKYEVCAVFELRPICTMCKAVQNRSVKNAV